jgi:hypothetical protein
MSSHESPGVLRRIWTALVDALKRGILGKSSQGYLKQFGAGDEYWDRVIAAQLARAQEQPPKPEPDRFRVSGNGARPAGLGVQDATGRPPEPESGLVHGWTRRQRNDYLPHNPVYRSSSEAE